MRGRSQLCRAGKSVKCRWIRWLNGPRTGVRPGCVSVCMSVCDERKGGWMVRGWEGVRSELGEAGLPCHARFRAMGSLGVCDGERGVHRQVRGAAGSSARKLLSWSKQEGMVAWVTSADSKCPQPTCLFDTVDRAVRRQNPNRQVRTMLPLELAATFSAWFLS